VNVRKREVSAKVKAVQRGDSQAGKKRRKQARMTTLKGH
jgi:hypothetical protein